MYIKQHGSASAKLPMCFALPNFITIPVLILFCIGTYFWINNIRTRVLSKNQFVNNDYFELAIISALIIIPFIFLDIDIIRLLSDLASKYYKS